MTVRSHKSTDDAVGVGCGGEDNPVNKTPPTTITTPQFPAPRVVASLSSLSSLSSSLYIYPRIPSYEREKSITYDVSVIYPSRCREAMTRCYISWPVKGLNRYYTTISSYVYMYGQTTRMAKVVKCYRQSTVLPRSFLYLYALRFYTVCIL